MSFAWPLLLWLLLIPTGMLAWELTHRRRAAAAPSHPKILRAEAGRHDMTFLGESASGGANRRVRGWLWAGVILAIVAMARPQWGRLEEPVFDQSREILLAVDLSRSMLAPDVRPSRLDRAKLLIQSLLERLAGERVGLVVFSGTAFLQSPLSADYEILREFLPSLGPDFLPEGGTNYSSLIDASLQAFGGSGAADRFLVILSDGEATDDDWKSAAVELKKKGIRVIGLGVGTADGAMIPDGSGGFVKDERGAVVLSKLESRTLQDLAQMTGGVYRDASTWVDLPALLRQTIEAGKKGRFVETNTVRYAERFQWPLAVALWCFLISLCYEFPIRPRPRTIELRSQAPGGPAVGGRSGARQQAAAGVVSGLLILGLLITGEAKAAATLARPPAQAEQSPPLAKIVGRLAATDTRTARDWAELGRETVTWGSHLKTEQQAVPEGPVRDALAAVELGEKMDAAATDWPHLREELEALLKKPEDEKDQDKKDQQQQDKDQKNEDQKNQDKKSQDQKSDSGKESKDPSQSDQKDSQSQQQNKSGKQQQKESDAQKTDQSAFGDMNQKQPPPQAQPPKPPTPPQGDMQKVGGAQQKKDQPSEPLDPALAMPTQKLDELKNQDSPAKLFELMERQDRPPQKKSGKNW
jgi:Ca-activated chloride channel family protein